MVEADSGDLIGALMLAREDASRAETAAIRCGVTVRDIARTLLTYLTTVEGLKLDALSFDRKMTRRLRGPVQTKERVER